MTCSSVIYLTKLIATILLLASFFMPLSSCGVKLAGPLELGTEEQPRLRLVERDEPVVSYAYELFQIDDYESWLFPLAFVWPIPLLLYQRFGRPKVKGVLTFLGLLLCVGSVFMLVIVVFFEEPLYGVYVALVAIVSYFLASIVEAYLIVRQYIAERKSRTTG